MKDQWMDFPERGRYWWRGGGHDIFPGVVRIKSGRYVVWPAGVSYGSSNAEEIEPKYPTLKAAKFACRLIYSGGGDEKPSREGDQS